MRRRPNCSCIVCGVPVYRRPREMQRGRVFCSQKCFGVSCQRPVDCTVCGKKILSGKNAATCSRACSNTSRKGIRYGLGQPKNKRVAHVRMKNTLIDLRGAKCEDCGYDRYSEILHVHHVIPRSKGGTNDVSNLKLLCPNCHYGNHLVGRVDQLVDQQS